MLCCLLLYACSSRTPAQQTPTLTIQPPPTDHCTPTTALSPSLTPTSTAENAPEPTITEAALALPRICAPIQGYTLVQLPEMVSNPFHPPGPGSDEPHQGVDLAVRAPGTQVALAGQPVQAALAGQVVMVTRERFPFGNAVIIETPLETQPEGWWMPAAIPSSAPTLTGHGALTCPDEPGPNITDPERRSLYILYAHLQAPSSVQPGDPVTCGQVIGAIGSTGNALNPHLHFEAKIGPAGIRIASMAHYDASATQFEMSNYCMWSISGLFQVVDPLQILRLDP